MAKVVDKEEKRHNIAISCRDLLLDNGIENLTISEIAGTAGVGKGTIYEYFENKDDIVFEIIRTFLSEYQGKMAGLVNAEIPTRQKLFEFFDSFFSSEHAKRHMGLYKEFISISMTRGTDDMLSFNEVNRGKFVTILNKILEEGIAKGEISEQFRNAASSLVVFNSGLVIHSRFNNFDVHSELNKFLDMLFGESRQGEEK
jgi:AcrR family transcriptional regulator